jgi:hypothetical protein
MYERCVKTLLLVSIAGLAHVNPVFAAVKKQMEAAGKYYDDVLAEGSLGSLDEFKKKRDAETKRLRDEIFTIRPALKSERDDMAQRITERKVKIIRERNFLESEFENGVNRIYQQAVDRFLKKDYAASRNDFEDIEQLSPGFKETNTYLKKLEKLDDTNRKMKSTDISMNSSRPGQYAGFKGKSK